MSNCREADALNPQAAPAWTSPRVAQPKASAARKAGSRWSEARSMRQTFVLNLEHGLHARPCALLVKTLRPFRSDIQVESHGQLANGHSIMGLMALAAAKGSELTFTISGGDALQALAAISRLFETNFEEAYHPPELKHQTH